MKPRRSRLRDSRNGLIWKNVEIDSAARSRMRVVGFDVSPDSQRAVFTLEATTGSDLMMMTPFRSG